MKTWKTAGLVGAMLLGASSLAFAQTSTTSPSSSTPAPSTTQHNTTGSGAATGSGTSTAPMKMTEQDVKKKLEGAGYTQVSDVKPDKDGYTAKAMKSGKEVHLDVDKNGKIEEMKR